MAVKTTSLFFVLLLISAHPLCVQAFWAELAGAVAGGAVMLVAAPAALTALGFTAVGITAGSIGAGLMSLAAVTGYGGAVIGILQSVGAAGFAATSVISAAVFGAGVAHMAKDKDE
jgi:hypothetical protein